MLLRLVLATRAARLVLVLARATTALTARPVPALLALELAPPRLVPVTRARPPVPVLATRAALLRLVLVLPRLALVTRALLPRPALALPKLALAMRARPPVPVLAPSLRRLRRARTTVLRAVTAARATRAPLAVMRVLRAVTRARTTPTMRAAPRLALRTRSPTLAAPSVSVPPLACSLAPPLLRSKRDKCRDWSVGELPLSDLFLCGPLSGKSM